MTLVGRARNLLNQLPLTKRWLLVWWQRESCPDAEAVAFDELDLAVVAIKYIDGNEQSKRAVEKYVESFGGRYEGLLRNWLAAGNDVYDCHRYTISRPEYESSSR